MNAHSLIPKIILIVSLYPDAHLTAQSANTIEFYDSAIASLKNRYMQYIGDQSVIYNGGRYLRYPFSFNDGAHPYFETFNFGRGSLVYDGVLYRDVDLLYDEVTDELITTNVSRRDMVRLFNHKVSAFEVHDRKFLRLRKDSINPNIFKTGYYQILGSGKTRLLKKEVKQIVEKAQPTGLEHLIETRRYYYIHANGAYREVRSRKSLLALLPDKKKELSAFMRSNRLKLRKNREEDLIKTISYYDQLSK